MRFDYFSDMLKKLLVLLAVVLPATYALAGDSTQVKKFKRFYAGIALTPGVGWRLLKVDNSESLSTTDAYDLERREKDEKPEFSFGAGIKLGVRVTKYLAIESGLEYAYISYSNNGKNNLTPLGFYSSQSPPTSFSWEHLKYNHHYLNLPVGLHFTAGKKQVQGAFSTGVVLNGFLRRTVTTYKYIDSKLVEKNASNGDDLMWANFNISPYLGIGIDYRIKELMTLRIMPLAQMQVLNNIEPPIREYLWSAGVNFCLLFNAGKWK